MEIDQIAGGWAGLRVSGRAGWPADVSISSGDVCRPADQRRSDCITA